MAHAPSSKVKEPAFCPCNKFNKYDCNFFFPFSWDVEWRQGLNSRPLFDKKAKTIRKL